MAELETLPIHGNPDSAYSLYFTVVSTGNTVRAKLTEALLAQEQRQHLQYKLFVNSCENLKQIVPHRNLNDVHIDFIVFLIDSAKYEWLQDIDENVRYLDKAFFFGRFCFVLTQSTLYQVTATNVKLLREKYQCNVLVINDVLNSEKWFFLAERILNLCIAVCGLKSGMSPCISI